MIEQMLTDLHTADPEWNVVLLRYFNPIGAHASGLIGEDPKGIPNNLLPYVAQTAIGKREAVHVFGDDYPTPDGTGVRDYIHVCDLASGHAAALAWMNGREGVEVFNLGTGRGTSVLEIIRAFGEACGHEVPYVIDPRRPGDVAENYADCSKARDLMGWGRPSTASTTCAAMPGTGSPTTPTATRDSGHSRRDGPSRLGVDRADVTSHATIGIPCGAVSTAPFC